MRRTATLALAAVMLVGCAHAAPIPAADPSAALVAHYPGCAGKVQSHNGFVTCRLPGYFNLTAFTAPPDKAQQLGETMAQLDTTSNPPAQVDAIDQPHAGGQVVVIIRASDP